PGPGGYTARSPCAIPALRAPVFSGAAAACRFPTQVRTPSRPVSTVPDVLANDPGPVSSLPPPGAGVAARRVPARPIFWAPTLAPTSTAAGDPSSKDDDPPAGRISDEP